MFTVGSSLSSSTSFFDLFIRNFSYVLSVLIFYTKMVLFLLHLVVDLSFYSLQQIIVRVLILIMECSILFALLDPLQISFESPFFHQYFFNLFLRIFLLYLSVIIFLESFLSFELLYILPSLLVSPVVAVSLIVLLASFPIRVLHFCPDWFMTD